MNLRDLLATVRDFKHPQLSTSINMVEKQNFLNCTESHDAKHTKNYVCLTSHDSSFVRDVQRNPCRVQRMS